MARSQQPRVSPFDPATSGFARFRSAHRHAGAKRTPTSPLGEPHWQPVVRKQDRERWNDWGIGLLLQGDLKGAEYAFQRVTEAEPGYADGWLNVARALIQEGETDAAKPYHGEGAGARARNWRARYFFMAHGAEGGRRLRWRARNRWSDARAQYPRDRVVLNQIAPHPVPEAPIRAKPWRRSEGAATSIPEDVQMHYTLMLCYRGLGDADTAAARREAVPPVQSGRIVAGAHRQSAPVEPGGQQ